MKSLNLEQPILHYIDAHPECTFGAIHRNFPAQSRDTLYGILKRLTKPMEPKQPQIERLPGKLYRALPVQAGSVKSTLRVSCTQSPIETYTQSTHHTREVGTNAGICTSVFRKEERKSDTHTGYEEWEEENITPAVYKLLELAGPGLLEGPGRWKESVTALLGILVSAQPRIVMQALVRLGQEYDAEAHVEHNRSHNPRINYDDRPKSLPLQGYSWATVEVQRWFRFDSKTKECVRLNHQIIGTLHYMWTDIAQRIGHDFINDLRQAVYSVTAIPAPQSKLEQFLLKYRPPAEILAFNLKAVHLRRTAVRKEHLALVEDVNNINAWMGKTEGPEYEKDYSD